MAHSSETHTTPAGARVEVGTFTFEGRDFQALGSIVDTSSGFVVGYPARNAAGDYELHTWGGETIAPLRKVNDWKQRGFGGWPNTIVAWSMALDGRTFSGRNSGEGMLLRMRAK